MTVFYIELSSLSYSKVLQTHYLSSSFWKQWRPKHGEVVVLGPCKSSRKV